jgi:hypothetical protein
MEDISLTLKLLTSYEVEVQRLIPWGVWGLLLHQSARWSFISLMLDPVFFHA